MVTHEINPGESGERELKADHFAEQGNGSIARCPTPSARPAIGSRLSTTLASLPLHPRAVEGG